MLNNSGTEGYRQELSDELRRLEISQQENPSEYKEERIARLKGRLGATYVESNPLLDEIHAGSVRSESDGDI